MKKNIGTKDRLLRLTIALILFLLAWWLQSWIILGFALFTLYEAAASWCIWYQLTGQNSCPMDKK
jgi:Protein of unknown function (DUF2892)